MLIARRQTLVQLTDELIGRLDAVARRDGRTRSDLIRDAIEGLLDHDEQVEIDRQIIEGYTRTPPTDDDDAWAEVTSRLALAALPPGEWDEFFSPQERP